MLLAAGGYEGSYGFEHTAEAGCYCWGRTKSLTLVFGRKTGQRMCLSIFKDIWREVKWVFVCVFGGIYPRRLEINESR